MAHWMRWSTTQALGAAHSTRPVRAHLERDYVERQRSADAPAGELHTWAAACTITSHHITSHVLYVLPWGATKVTAGEQVTLLTWAEPQQGC